MNAAPPPVAVAPRQLRLKKLCIWIEAKFERRLGRGPFARRMIAAAAAIGAVTWILRLGLAEAPVAILIPLWLLAAWAGFWIILETVRRFHDLSRSGNLFWAVAIPYWVSWRIIALFHLVEKYPQYWGVWIFVAAICAWPVWLTLQLFLKRGTDGPNG